MLLSAFKLAFFGFLRRGEVTIKSSSELNNAIRINAIMFSANKPSYVLHISASKSGPCCIKPSQACDATQTFRTSIEALHKNWCLCDLTQIDRRLANLKSGP